MLRFLQLLRVSVSAQRCTRSTGLVPRAQTSAESRAASPRRVEGSTSFTLASLYGVHTLFRCANSIHVRPSVQTKDYKGLCEVGKRDDVRTRRRVAVQGGARVLGPSAMRKASGPTMKQIGCHLTASLSNHRDVMASDRRVRDGSLCRGNPACSCAW